MCPVGGGRDLAVLTSQYYIYLFERILLCCKEVGAPKKQKQTIMGKGSRLTPGPKPKTKLQLKGRIFMQNVTDVISLAGSGMCARDALRA